jgi:3-dehydroquinate dehydratase/shikimate dehydrogenase
VLNRTAEAGQKLAREAKAKTFRKDHLAKAQWDVIINATPVGMTGNKQQTWLEPNEINARFVFDMVYDPLETPLLRMAKQKGSQVITGAEMFVHQGAEQFQIWTGKPAPREEMMRVVLHALQQRALANPAPPVQEKPMLVEKLVAAQEKLAEKKPEKAAPAKAPAKPLKPVAVKPVVKSKTAAAPAKKSVVRPASKPARTSKPAPAKKSRR